LLNLKPTIMKKIILSLSGSLLILLAVSCKKNADVAAPAPETGVSDAVKAKISALGLTATGAYKTDGGYIAEGDIFLDDETLNSTPEQSSFIVAGTEHYRTTNLVTGLPRTITVRYSGTNTAISNAVNAAISRYNALGLLLRFSRVTSGGNIVVTGVSGVSYIASAGFPSGGNPYNAIRFNTAYAVWNANTLASVMAHEMGHCIGMRHTDLACRQYSCGGSPVNEGSAGVGAIHIPGTPTACNADPTSWMLACIGNGVNRPFNANDQVALNFLY
jgi:Dual-action HEIGH metallo-peptidase